MRVEELIVGFLIVVAVAAYGLLAALTLFT
jgi:hypothetical protein